MPTGIAAEKSSMKTRILYVCGLAFVMTLSAGCSREMETSSLQIRLPKATSTLEKSLTAQTESPADGTSQWNSSLNPTEHTQVNCYGIFVGGPEPELQRNHCKMDDGKKIFFGPHLTFAKAGNTITMTVPAGNDRVISVFGIVAQNGACGPVKDVPPDFANLSQPHLIAETTVNLEAGDNEVLLTAKLEHEKTLDTCDIISPGEGDGGNVDDPVVLPVPKPLRLSEGGGRSPCLIFDDGSAKCWGSNVYGQLGTGDTANLGDNPGEMGAFLPFLDLGTGLKATHISNGLNHSCALFDSGQVKCWGKNNFGQLGIGDTTDRGGAPGQMGDSLPFVDLGTGRTAKSIQARNDYTCAILDDDQIKCWGNNSYGKLGIGNTTHKGSSAAHMGDSLAYVDLGTGRTALKLALGGSSACALLDNQSVKCWGRGSGGQLGSGGTLNIGDNPGEMGDSNTAVDVNGSVVDIVSTRDSRCVLMSDNSLKCWGINGFGQLGAGNTTSVGISGSQMGSNLAVVDIGTGRLVSRLFTAGATNICLERDDSSIICFGSNGKGQLGIGSTNHIGDAPGEMGDFLTAVDLGHGAPVIDFVSFEVYNCVLFADEQLKCFGANDFGQLGLEDVSYRGDNPGELGTNLPFVQFQ